MALWFSSFMVLWFDGFLVSTICQNLISCVLIDIDGISMIFKILRGSSTFPGARLFDIRYFGDFQNSEIYRTNSCLKCSMDVSRFV